MIVIQGGGGKTTILATLYLEYAKSQEQVAK